MSSRIMIAVSGKSGCGNTSVSRIIADTLGLRLINYTFHDMARERGISFEQMCLLAEQDSQYDLHVDRTQVRFASQGDCVLGSRLAIWLLKDADLKAYLDAPLEVRALRIAGREGLDYQPTLKATAERDERDKLRYSRLYNIDTDQYEFADIVVDAVAGDQYYLADLIIRHLRAQKLGARS